MSGRLLRRPQRIYPAATVADFCTAILRSLGRCNRPKSGRADRRSCLSLVQGELDSLCTLR